jgi:hypothetical protein
MTPRGPERSEGAERRREWGWGPIRTEKKMASALKKS